MLDLSILQFIVSLRPLLSTIIVRLRNSESVATISPVLLASLVQPKPRLAHPNRYNWYNCVRSLLR